MMTTPTLNLQNITDQIDECLLNHTHERDSCSTGNQEGILQSLRCRRGVDKDMDAIQRFSLGATVTGSTRPLASGSSHPLHFYVLFESSDDNNESEFVLKGVAMWYFGYSTWQGKVMNIDTLLASNDGSVNEKMVLDVLVKIAISLSLRRIVYQIQGSDEAEFFKQKYGADLLGEWLTLAMRRDQMTSFLNTQSTWDPLFSRSKDINNSIICVGKGSTISKKNNFNLTDINYVIDTVLTQINPSVKRRKSSLQLRRAEENDAGSILNLVRGLALYEKALHEVYVDERIYKLDGGGDNPMYYCILLEGGSSVEGDVGDTEHTGHTNACTKTEAVVGMGFFYFGYSLTGGRFLYLEDLFIKKEHRGNGYGKAIMYVLAEIARDLNCQSFVWQALDWNTPALNFYNSIGAEVCDGLITLRFDQERIDDYKFTWADDKTNEEN